MDVFAPCNPEDVEGVELPSRRAKNAELRGDSSTPRVRSSISAPVRSESRVESSWRPPMTESNCVSGHSLFVKFQTFAVRGLSLR
jgi:hypothetical protein